MKRKSKKKSRAGKIFVLLILIGAGLFALIHFRQEILNALKPRVEKKVVSKERREITLFFSDEEGEYLIGEKRQILKRGDVEKEAKEAVTELTRGPKGKLIPTLPPQTKLLALELDENVAGFFCYLFVFVTGIVFLVVEKKSSFVKFHAMQSTITFLSLLVISILFGWVPVIGALIWIGGLVLWLLLMIKALQGQRYALPIVGKMAEQKTNQ